MTARRALIVALLLAFGCSREPVDAGTDCAGGAHRCTAGIYEACFGGAWEVSQNCAGSGLLCDDIEGCVVAPSGVGPSPDADAGSVVTDAPQPPEVVAGDEGPRVAEDEGAPPVDAPPVPDDVGADPGPVPTDVPPASDASDACEDAECAAPSSCTGRCGEASVGEACGCDPSCFESQTCCPDVCEECAGELPVQCGQCVPLCGAAECGPDGCGGSCGTCGAAAVCGGGQCLVDGAECDDGGFECAGTVVVFCAEGQLNSSDCADLDQVCGYDGEFGWFDCADEATCTPSCAGRECGDAGCGETCGTCAEGEICIWGNCLTPGD